MTPVVELLRVSGASQASEDRYSLPAQHSVIERICQQYGLQVVECVQIVMSGAEVADTPEMARVLELITSGQARGVVLAEYSRLFRPDRWTDLRVLQTFADHSANIYLPSGPLDLLTEAGFVNATVYNMVSALERRRIRERMHRGKEEVRRRLGHAHGRMCLPLGVAYSREEGWSYTPDIDRVRKVFRLFLAGERNMEEVGRRAGVARTTALYILQNPVYTGWRVFDRKRDPSPQGFFGGRKYRRTIARAPDEVIRVQLPLEPVISEAAFADVQLLLSAQKRQRPRRSRYPLRYLYRGFASCTCAQPLYGIVASSAKRTYYRCRSMVGARRPDGIEPCGAEFMRVDQLEPVLDSVISDRLLDPAVIMPAIGLYNDSVADAWRRLAPEQRSVAERIKEVERRRARIIGSYVDGVIGRAERDTRLVPIDQELAALRAMPVAVVHEPATLTRDDLHALIGALAEWALIDRAARRRLLEAMRPDFVVRDYAVAGVHFPIVGSHNVGHCRRRSWRRRRARAPA